MTMTPTTHPSQGSFAVGTEFRATPRCMTRDRMRWYVDTQATVAADDGRHHRGGPTIHDDDAYAAKQGLKGIIADGMVSTNWLLDLLLKNFGEGILARGALSTKYIAPVYEDQVLISCARVQTAEREADGQTCYGLEVWCEDDTGLKVTVGKATVRA
ncbi:MAG: hypothetical protein JWP29_2571 [Rhodoferax sp.]|nr:hypothetical protein [Rhodoferax sp.]